MATEPGPQSRIRLRIFLTLFCSFLATIVAVAIGFSYSAHHYWRKVLCDEITRNLAEKTRMFAARVETDRAHQIQDITSQEGQSAGARATVIDVNGKVIADSEAPIASLENEGRAPEFATALRGDTGVETRKRNPFAIPVLYVAIPVSGGAVRLAYPVADIGIAASGARNVLLASLAVAILAGLAVSWWATERVARS